MGIDGPGQITVLPSLGTSSPGISYNLVDAACLYDASTDINKEYALQHQNAFSYDALAAVLDNIRSSLGFDAPKEKVVFFAVHPANSKQIRFAESLQGWSTKLVDYRETYVLPTPRRSGATPQTPLSPPKSMSNYLSFVIGAAYADPNPAHMLIVTGDFGVYPALAKLASDDSNRVAIAFFGSRMDPRWEVKKRFRKITGYDLLTPASKHAPGTMSFFDLEDDREIMSTLFSAADFTVPDTVDPFDFVHRGHR